MRHLMCTSALSGCAWAAASGPGTTPAAAPEPPASACPMAAFPPHVLALRAAVLRNDRSTLRTELAWMQASEALPTSLRVPTGPSEGSLDATTEEAHAASVFLGTLGVACGSCHARGQGPATPPPVAAATPAGAAPHMERHLWAIDHLWDGLIGPSELSWNQGVAELAGLDLDPAQFAGRDEQDSPAGYLGTWIRRTGLVALHTGDIAARGRIYGDLLSTCADCHAGTQGAPDAEHPSPL